MAKKKWIKIVELGYEDNPGCVTVERDGKVVKMHFGFQNGWYFQLSPTQQRRLAYFLLNKPDPRKRKKK